MCGFYGFIGQPRLNFEDRWNKAQNLQIHRGPDNQKQIILNSKFNKIFVAFQRLSIIDPSPLANQPMFSEDKNSLILFNGEIYNFIEIRKELELEGVKFRTSSDTEVLLKSILLWGHEKTCQKINGMWSYAFIDIERDKLFLSRDRFGKKPLYIFISDDGLYFSSEAKSIL